MEGEERTVLDSVELPGAEIFDRIAEGRVRLTGLVVIASGERVESCEVPGEVAS